MDQSMSYAVVGVVFIALAVAIVKYMKSAKRTEEPEVTSESGTTVELPKTELKLEVVKAAPPAKKKAAKKKTAAKKKSAKTATIKSE